MRAFEVLTLVLALGSLLACRFRGVMSLRRRHAVALLSFVAVLLHLSVDGLRWQMVPCYTLLVAAAAYSAAGADTVSRMTTPRRGIRLLLTVPLVAWCASAVLLPAMLPVFDLPRPTGRFRVGTKDVLLVDRSRLESFLPDGREFRRIPVQVFYPAEVDEAADPDVYLRDAYRSSRALARADGFGFLPFLWSHLGRVRTNSFSGAPVSRGRPVYPVVVFSHGYWQSPNFNTIVLEDLASHGFVVLSLTHEYETPIARYPDGDVRTFSRDLPAHRRRQADDRSHLTGPVLDRIHRTTDPREQETLYRQFYDLVSVLTRSNDEWVKDIRFCIDELPRLGETHVANRLDPRRVGVAGYSFGGGASGSAALVDKRIQACFNLDGFQYGHLLGERFTCPVMFVQSERRKGSHDFFTARAVHDVFDLMVAGATHTSFTDSALRAPLPARMTGVLGSLGAGRGLTIARDLVSSFFEAYLIDNDRLRIEEMVARHPEIEVRQVATSR